MKLKRIEEVNAVEQQESHAIERQGMRYNISPFSSEEEVLHIQKNRGRNIGNDANFLPSPTRIAVIGVGGGGVNAVNDMAGKGIQGVDLYAANTDTQTLGSTRADYTIHLGYKSGRGLGVGGDPAGGAEAAREVREEIHELLLEYDMIFLASGLGGGTGTGAMPVIAELAKEARVLTIAIVTMPFSHEGSHRIRNAERGLEELEECTDALLVIPNDKILQNDVLTPDVSVTNSFSVINTILSDTVSSITDIITQQGIINIDFADIKTCLKDVGRVSIGIGESGSEENHGGNAHRAIDMALKSKILSDENVEVLNRANNIMVNVVLGTEVSMQDYAAIPDIIISRTSVSAQALKQGYRIEPSWKHKVHVTIIASSNRKIMEEDARDFQKSFVRQQQTHGDEYADIVTSDVSSSGYVSANNFSKLIAGVTTGDDSDDLFSDEIDKTNYDASSIKRHAEQLEMRLHESV